MSGFSLGSFSFSRSGRAGGLGGMLGHSHSSGHRGHYRPGGHYRQVRHRRSGCLGCLPIGAVALLGVGGGLAGLLHLLT